MADALIEWLGCVPGNRSSTGDMQANQNPVQALHRTGPPTAPTPRHEGFQGFPFTGPESLFKFTHPVDIDPIPSVNLRRIEDLEERISDLERIANEHPNPPDDLDILLSYDPPDTVASNHAEDKNTGERGEAPSPSLKSNNNSNKCSCTNPCDFLWGGPTMPSSDQNMWGFVENFFGGVTTAHGINQAFKDNNGILRRIVWILFFALAFWGLYWAAVSAVIQFIDAYGASQVTTVDHDALLPMITLCSLSPVRCSCSAFYHPTIIADDTLVRRVLPYLCSSVLVFKNTSWEPLNSASAPLSYDLLEHADRYVELAATKARMAALPTSSKLTCDSPGYSEANVVARIVDGKLTLQELYAYAGYAVRSRLIRGCMATDTRPGSASIGQKVSCMGDEWWGAPLMLGDYGACQIFNPCHGFPVGQACDTDADCAHGTIKARAGGMWVAVME